MEIKARMDGERKCWLKNKSSRLSGHSFFQGGLNHLKKSLVCYYTPNVPCTSLAYHK